MTVFDLIQSLLPLPSNLPVKFQGDPELSDITSIRINETEVILGYEEVNPLCALLDD